MQNKKIIKRKKFNIIKFIVVILFIYIAGYFVFSIFNTSIKNIYIYNNNYISDQEIIDTAEINNYPSFLFTSKNSIKKKLLKNPIINNVKVNKKFYSEIHITIEENKPLFIDKLSNKTVLSNGIKIKEKYSVPILINEIPEGIYDNFISKMDKLSDDTLLKMSEIEYKPNNIDKERILVTMTDGNYVYLTLYKFGRIDKYNDLLPSLEGKRGIIYFDSGNYFEILN